MNLPTPSTHMHERTRNRRPAVPHSLSHRREPTNRKRGLASPPFFTHSYHAYRDCFYSINQSGPLADHSTRKGRAEPALCSLTPSATCHTRARTTKMITPHPDQQRSRIIAHRQQGKSHDAEFYMTRPPSHENKADRLASQHECQAAVREK